MKPNEKLDPKWQRFYYIATYIIAIVALCGIYVSYDSIRMSALVAESLQAMNTPLVKFQDVCWVSAKQSVPVSCTNSPTGLIFTIHNPSSVPVQLHKQDWAFFFGERELPKGEVTVGKGESMVLAPNERTQSGQILPAEFKNIFGKEKDLATPPHLRIRLSVEFSRLHGKKRYIYKTTRQVMWDCRSPTIAVNTMDESIEAVKP